MVNKALFSSKKSDWCTPKNIVDLVQQFRTIELDPCSNPNSIVGALETYSLENNQDGLALLWKSFNYVNPPYSKGKLIKWVAKAESEYVQNCVESIVLVPARTDTKWFHKHCSQNTICFIKGRLKFLGAPSSAPFPSMLVYYGNDDANFELHFCKLGKILTGV